MIEKVKYYFWKHWYMANLPFNSPIRFMGMVRVTMVYDPLFKEKGLAAVKEKHAEHLESMKAKLEGYK